MKIRIETIIFDFDGVLIDSGRDIADAVNHMLRQIGKEELEYEEIIRHVGNGAKRLVQECVKSEDDELLKKAVDIYKGYYLNHCVEKTGLYPNVLQVLEHYRDKNLAVVSNKPEEISKAITKKLGIDKFVRLVIGPESVVNIKPHPESLIKAADFFGTSPEKCVMVGDTYTDIIAGKAAKMHTCGVTYGLGETEPLKAENPDFLAGNIIELIEFFV